jgi:hypothetical protein
LRPPWKWVILCILLLEPAIAIHGNGLKKGFVLFYDIYFIFFFVFKKFNFMKINGHNIISILLEKIPIFHIFIYLQKYCEIKIWYSPYKLTLESRISSLNFYTVNNCKSDYCQSAICLLQSNKGVVRYTYSMSFVTLFYLFQTIIGVLLKSIVLLIIMFKMI